MSASRPRRELECRDALDGLIQTLRLTEELLGDPPRKPTDKERKRILASIKRGYDALGIQEHLRKYPNL